MYTNQNDIMEDLFSYQNKLIDQAPGKWYRYAFDKIDWDQRLLGIKGLRGVGKSTMMLQFLKHHYKKPKQALYVTADHPWFYDHSIYELIDEWYKNDGKLLVIDEIHKYPQWARELKVGYDGHPDMQFIFSASSAFDIFKAEADLSRRAVVTTLPGMSFREYLEFTEEEIIQPVSLEKLLLNSDDLSRQITRKIKPIPHFKKYMDHGYFPFSAPGNDMSIPQKFAGIVNAVLENDLAYVQDYSPANIQKIKKLLGVIAGSAPFTPNISKIADKLKAGRKTVYNYLVHLEEAHILNLIHKTGRGISALQKPDKIYFENTNLATALDDHANKGALRETFFVNQIRNAGHTLHLAPKGDFIIDEKITFEIGGKNKTQEQIKGIDNAFIAADDIEYANGNKIPLWLFGLLY